VLDVGANLGSFAVYAKLFYHRRAVVHCFEPFPPTLERLRRNVASFADVVVHPFALGGRDGEATLYLHRELSGCHSLVRGLFDNPRGEVRVPVRNAGRVWDELGLEEVDVLKMDTEGSEVEILEALGDRLSRVRSVLAEFHRREDRRRIDALLPGFTLFGFKFHSVDVGVVKYGRADLVGR
jgi:FkbM family methyltransferase